MKLKLLARIFLLLVVLSGSYANADLSDCNDLYVGRIWVEKDVGLKGTVLLNNPTSSSGSFWIWFNAWGESDKNSALALLMAAKMSQHKVNIRTDAPDGCSITSAQQSATNLYLATNP